MRGVSTAARPNDRPAIGTGNRSKSGVPRLALSVEEACAALGVSWDLWREHIEPEVRVVRCGRRKLVAVAELERWLAASAERTLDGR
jgi:hypothetical protein